MNDIMKDFTNTLNSGFAQYGYAVTTQQLDKLVKFNQMVMETNKHTNLTSIEDGEESAKKHFLDSLNPSAINILKNATNVIDVGSGAGFPGIPLAIMNSSVNFTLLDTRMKRCEFMEMAKETLELDNVDVVWGRAEDLGRDKNFREQFDVACARALAAMPTLLEFLSPFIKVDGYAMLYKSKSTIDEINISKNAAEILGIGDFQVMPYTVYNDPSTYNIVSAKKTFPIPTKYPRKAGLPLKRPL